MNATDVLRRAIDSASFVVDGYLSDLTEEDMLFRPCKGANHIKWQLGHLIASENMMLERVFPGAMPPLPDGFEVRYGKAAAGNDAPGDFDSKDDLLRAAAQQRQGTLEALAKATPEDLGRESGLSYAPTVADIFIMQANHWLMHAGQWAVVRRMRGRPPLF